MFCITLFHVRIIDILFSFCGISYTDVPVCGPIIMIVVKPGVPAKTGALSCWTVSWLGGISAQGVNPRAWLYYTCHI